MKKLFIYLATVFLIISCKEGNKKSSQPEETSTVQKLNFDWLQGKWKRQNDEAGKQTFENWKKISEDQYAGEGFTMQAADTVWQENMQIFKLENNSWKLRVIDPNAQDTVFFDLAQLTENSFAFENNEIEFPNLISYSKDGATAFTAKVEGSDMEIDFKFEKLNK